MIQTIDLSTLLAEKNLQRDDVLYLFIQHCYHGDCAARFDL